MGYKQNQRIADLASQITKEGIWQEQYGCYAARINSAITLYVSDGGTDEGYKCKINDMIIKFKNPITNARLAKEQTIKVALEYLYDATKKLVAELTK